ncbi:MAG: DnaA/Hda family protein [Alphaproteobacteria bacterium]|nr:DnaA/Hda family protein [Alphaproteobacteria bacterium]MCY4317969.1 DnaA/Hda family protein [Alphaproteobacteria bacterium]
MRPTTAHSRQFVLHLGHRTAMGAEDFLVADSNAEAVAWIDRWPDWPAPVLTVWGLAGAGKTHLAHVWQARSAAAMLAPAALAQASAVNLLGGRRHLVIDGADSAVDELALLHLYNLLASQGGSLLLTAALPPARWRIQTADLASRLAAGPAVAIRAPDDRLLEAVLAKQFADRQIEISQEVLDLLLRRIERSFAAARRAVDSLDRAGLAGRRRITAALVRDLLAEGAFEESASEKGAFQPGEDSDGSGNRG